MSACSTCNGTGYAPRYVGPDDADPCDDCVGSDPNPQYPPSDPRHWCRVCRPGPDPFEALLGLCYDHTPTSRAHELDVLTCDDPAGAFAHLLYLHGPEALGLRRLERVHVDLAGHQSSPRNRPPYFVLPDEREDW